MVDEIDAVEAEDARLTLEELEERRREPSGLEGVL